MFRARARLATAGGTLPEPLGRVILLSTGGEDVEPGLRMSKPTRRDSNPRPSGYEPERASAGI
jgi:hypothetical protein